MKWVIINEKNSEKIMSAFKAEQGRATVRTIDKFSELVRITESINERLHPMSKKAMDGTKAFYDFRQHFPSAYKYRPESTQFQLEYKSGNWRIDLESINRYTCPNVNTTKEYTLTLSESAKAEILKRFE